MTETSLLPVEPVDREAAAEVWRRFQAEDCAVEALVGGADHGQMIQAFARHRLAERDRAAGIAEGLAGPGALVGDDVTRFVLGIATAIRSPSSKEG